MKLLACLLTLLGIMLACNESRPPEKKWPDIKEEDCLVTDSSWGRIRSSTSFEELKKIIPHWQLSDTAIKVEEDYPDSLTKVTEVWGDHRFTIFWEKGGFHKQISFIRSDVNSYPYSYDQDLRKSTNGYPYLTDIGIKASSTLAELQKINGKKITFEKLFSHRSGYIKSYNGGTLKTSPLHFSFDLSSIEDSVLLNQGKYGYLTKVELDTDMPLVKVFSEKILVSGISLSFIKEGPQFKIPGREFMTASANEH